MKTLIFDTETTDLRLPRIANPDKQPWIIEFYGCLIDENTWQIEQELDLLIDVPVTITSEITKITGITKSDLSGKPRFDAIAYDVKTLIESADRVVAHNCSFDVDMIDGEMVRCGKTVDWPKQVCTVEQTEHLKGYRLKLTDLHEYLFDTGFKGAHRAREDVQALVRCYQELRERDEI